MPSKRNSVAPAATRPTRVAKTRGGKLITAAVRGMGRQSAPSPPPRDFTSPPPFDVDALGAVVSTMPQIQGLDNRFEILNQLSMRISANFVPLSKIHSLSSWNDSMH